MLKGVKNILFVSLSSFLKNILLVSLSPFKKK